MVKSITDQVQKQNLSEGRLHAVQGSSWNIRLSLKLQLLCDESSVIGQSEWALSMLNDWPVAMQDHARNLQQQR